MKTLKCEEICANRYEDLGHMRVKKSVTEKKSCQVADPRKSKFSTRYEARNR